MKRRDDDPLRAEIDNVKPFPGSRQDETKPSSLKVRSMADLQGTTPKPRQWLVRDWIPAGYITGLYGKGGGGKTTLAMQLCASSSLPSNGQWLGMEVWQAKPLGVFCEDDEDEIERRLHAIARGYGRPLDDFRAFDWLGRYGEDNLLVVRSRSGLETTAFYDQLKEQIADTKRDLVAIDGIVEVCGININDPAEVSYTLGRIAALGQATKATILLLGHPNKAGTSEFSGCATWENKPRARLFLGPPPKEDREPDIDPNDPRRVLRRSKANMAGLDQTDLVWRDGMFRAADPKFMTMAEQCEQSAHKAQARDAFLQGLEIASAAGVTLSPNCQAPNYAPRELVKKGWGSGCSKKELEEAMNTLMGEGRVTYGSAGYSASRNAKQTLNKVA